MCAMMPMLRSLASASAAATSNPYFVSSESRCLQRWLTPSDRAPACRRRGRTPGRERSLSAVVREGLVGFGHLVHDFATLDIGPEAVARVEQFVGQPLDHRLLAARPSVLHDPPQAKR